MPIWHGTVDEVQFRSLCEEVKHDGGKLLSLWGSDEQTRGNGYELHTALVTASGMICLTLRSARHTRPTGYQRLVPAATACSVP